MANRLGMNSTCSDNTFGPWAGSDCRGGFDFTLLFEESILALPLLCIFLIISPFYCGLLSGQRVKVVSSPLRYWKLCACVFLIAGNITLLILWNVRATSIPTTRLTIPTAAITLTVSLEFCILSWLEHDRNVRPSFILSIYLGLSVLLDLPRTRTLWMIRGSALALPILFTLTLALRLGMYILETIEKRSILTPSHQGLSRETTSSTFSRSLFVWLMPLFFNGYKNILTLVDLYPLDASLHSQGLYESLSDAWAKAPDKSKYGSFCKTWYKVFAWPMLAPVIPKLCQIGFTYSQPLLIEAAIKLAATPQIDPYNNYGYGLIGAYFLVYMGIAISTGQFEWHVYRVTSMMRGSVVAMIYEKSLKLDITSPSVSPEAALTLFNTDCETIIHGVLQIHELWGAVIEVTVGVYLIARQLGVVSALPVAILVVTMIVTFAIAVPTGKAQAAWIQASEDRVTITSKTLGGIKSLKISGLSDMAFNMIRDARTKELKISERCRILLGSALVLVVCVPTWIPIISFSVYAALAAGGSTTLTISRAFTSYALFILINKPLSDLVLALPLIATSITSFQRVQDHLNAKERIDRRTVGNGYQNKAELSRWDLHQHQVQSNSPVDEGIELDEFRSAMTSARNFPQDIIASVHGSFSWSGNSQENTVIDISLWNIYRREVTMILGPVGCGKSTLLKALLGELSDFEGTVHVNAAKIAYCAQTAWLSNDTIRNNIIGGSEIDEDWYETVVRACALDVDMRSWPNGENTVAGSRGISMSGGQKHRVSIARALYSKAEFLVFDDCFGGLDTKTENIVFNNLLGKNGLIRNGNMTLVLASSDTRQAQHSDQIVLLDEFGSIHDMGSPEELGTRLEQFEAEAHWDELPNQDTAQQEAVEIHRPDQQNLAVLEFMSNQSRRLGTPGMHTFYASAAGRKNLIIFVLALVVFAFTSAFPNIWLKWWSESNVTNPNGQLGKWLGVYIALGVGATLSALVVIMTCFVNIINRCGVYFHDLLSQTTSRAPISFHAKVDTGITINRFSQDLQLIDMELPSAFLGVAVGFAFVAADSIMVAISTRYMAAFVPIFLIVLYFVQRFYLRTSRQLRLLDIEMRAPLFSNLMQTLDGLSTIRSLQWDDHLQARNLQLLDDSQRPNYLLYCIQRWLTVTLDVMIAVLALALIFLTTFLRESIGPGYIGIAVSNILGLSSAMKAVLSSWVQLEVALGAVARIKIFSMETKPEDRTHGMLLGSAYQGWPSEGQIELQNVTASYDSSGVALSDVSFVVEPGQKVALCGRTGSGKSSLILCLLRMMELDQGSIIIDGVDTSKLAHEYVRSQLVALPQDAYTFNATVRQNLDPGGTATDVEILVVLEKLRLLSKIVERGGLDAVMSDKFFSQGEVQLLVFGRIMLRKGRVLILDEVTSSLDKEAGEIVSGLIKTWFQDWTIIAVIHKLDTIFDYDKVGVLDKGKLMEYDDPRLLLKREDSLFKLLYEGSTGVEHVNINSNDGLRRRRIYEHGQGSRRSSFTSLSNVSLSSELRQEQQQPTEPASQLGTLWSWIFGS